MRARNGAARAAAEFQKILDHPGVVLNFPLSALASVAPVVRKELTAVSLGT